MRKIGYVMGHDYPASRTSLIGVVSPQGGQGYVSTILPGDHGDLWPALFILGLMPMARSGRRPGAHFECDFVLQDPRVLDLTIAQWGFYSKLWVLSVNERRSVLCRNKFSTRSLQRLINVSRNSFTRMAQKCASLGLIEINNHFIKVLGVEGLHYKMEWKDPLECCVHYGTKMSQNESPIPEPEPKPEPEKSIKAKKDRPKIVPANNGYTDEFESFWNNYPRKTGKTPARTKFTSCCKKGARPEDLIAASKHYAESRAGKDSQFTMYPGKFLGQEFWKEYVNGPKIQETEPKTQTDIAAEEWIRRRREKDGNG